METNRDDWIVRWGRSRGHNQEARLREALATPRGRKLLRWFLKNKMHPDALAFCLVHQVWPIQAVKSHLWPPRATLARGTRQCRRVAQWLRKYGSSLELEGVETVCTQLERYADWFQDGKFYETFRFPAVSYMGASCLRPAHRARLQVIAFLRGYFVIAGKKERLKYDKRRTWKPITEVLILAGLISPETKPQRVGTIWSNALKRFEKRRAGRAEINFPAAMFSWFHIIKRKIDGKPRGRDVSLEIRRRLDNYWSSEQ